MCVCGGLRLCGSPHHTHSRQLLTISSHSRAQIRTPHACHHRCIPFHAVMATIEQCLTRAGHAGRPHGGGRVAAARRQGGGSAAADSWSAPRRCEHCPPTHRGGGVCVWWSQPLWLSSPHSLPPTPNHSSYSRARIRTPHACHHRCIPFHADHGHHRAVSNKGWACWPTTWWRQGGGSAAAGWRQGGGRQLVGSEAVRTLPTNTQGWWCVCVRVCVLWCVCVCVCVVVSASVALLTTLTPANS